MSQPVLLFLTGPSGAGKTTVAAAWAAARSSPTAVIDVDQIRSFVRAGPVSAETAAGARGDLRGHIAQYELSGSVAAAMARAYLAAGVDCAIVSQRSPRPPDEWAGEWVEMDPLDPTFVVLLPSLEVCLERNRIRRGDHGGMGDEVVVSNYGFGWQGWSEHPRATIIDSSLMSVDEVVMVVERIAAECPRRGS